MDPISYDHVTHRDYFLMCLDEVPRLILSADDLVADSGQMTELDGSRY